MEKKEWYKSKTIWAGIVTAVVGAAQAICLQFDFDLLSNPVAAAILSILGALGIYGRVKAGTEIK